MDTKELWAAVLCIGTVSGITTVAIKYTPEPRTPWKVQNRIVKTCEQVILPMIMAEHPQLGP